MSAVEAAPRPLASRRCLHHPVREAVARCPECREFYCRECITEHEDRVICSACLQRLAVSTARKPRRFGLLARPAGLVVGLLFAWLFFYCAGRLLVTIPASFHEGTLWGEAVAGE